MAALHVIYFEAGIDRQPTQKTRRRSDHSLHCYSLSKSASELLGTPRTSTKPHSTEAFGWWLVPHSQE